MQGGVRVMCRPIGGELERARVNIRQTATVLFPSIYDANGVRRFISMQYTRHSYVYISC